MVQYAAALDATFLAVADPTRRGILERLGKTETSITDLSHAFGMTLTGIKKHVAVLERAGLVATEKVGRVRTCRLGSNRLDTAASWIGTHQRLLDQRLDHLEQFLKRTQNHSR